MKGLHAVALRFWRRCGPLCLDVLLGASLLLGFVGRPLAFAHAAAVVLLLQGFLLPRRRAFGRLVIALASTTVASIAERALLRDVLIQLPFVYGLSALVILLAEELRNSRARSENAYREVERLALYDPLTSLPNRSLLHDRLAQAIAAAAREPAPLALLLMDLDGFKEVNDTFGHQAGDDVLAQVGARVREVMRASDTVARFGGDEFAILLPGADRACAAKISERLLRALERPFVIEGQDVEIGASIGAALYPDHGADGDRLMQRADLAMYSAKRALDSYEVYDAARDDDASRRLALMAELRQAIDRDELALHYQPIVRLDDRASVGVEALLRWNHPQRGLIPPADFIPAAERTGLIKPLTAWVLEAAVRQLAAWQRAGEPLAMSVNISMRNLVDPQLPELLERLLARYEARAALLTLEITESAITADEERAVKTVARLRRLGVRISIDDFGTGYSSLAYLTRLAPDEVKIDRSFVRDAASDTSRGAIVKASVELAHTLGCSVVAEGVEDEETLEHLAALGCDRAQGYHMSRPLPLPDLERWLLISPWGLPAVARVA